MNLERAVEIVSAVTVIVMILAIMVCTAAATARFVVWVTQ